MSDLTVRVLCLHGHGSNSKVHNMCDFLDACANLDIVDFPISNWYASFIPKHISTDIKLLQPLSEMNLVLRSNGTLLTAQSQSPWPKVSGLEDVHQHGLRTLSQS